MQSTIHIPTSNSPFNPHLQWQKLNKFQSFIPINQNPCFQTLSNPPKSLKTSIQFDFEDEQLRKEFKPTEPTLLPVVIRQSDGVSRYVWDGSDLQLVSVDGKTVCFGGFEDVGDGFRRLFRRCRLGVRNFLFPRVISENYFEYVKWKFLHRVFSSALQVLATQAMFRAIGIGYARSLPSAAALNWVLKDGLGRLSRCIYTASLASAFDTNLKRVRFSTSVVFSLSIGVELMTPAFPQYFLLLASIANIAKQISLACYLATGTAVHRSFAVADNLGEVSAKAQIQTVCFDNLGLMLAAALNVMLKYNQRLQACLPFVVYPIFTAIDLYGIYQSLKHVHLQTLTKDRLEMIIDTWIQFRYVPLPAEVSKQEGINFIPSKETTFTLYARRSAFTESKEPKVFFFVLREGASTTDIIMGVLQACYIRERLACKTGILEDSDSLNQEWFKLAKDCKRSARDDMELLNDKMVELGWACKNILLSTDEQSRFSFIDD